MASFGVTSTAAEGVWHAETRSRGEGGKARKLRVERREREGSRWGLKGLRPLGHCSTHQVGTILIPSPNLAMVERPSGLRGWRDEAIRYRL